MLAPSVDTALVRVLYNGVPDNAQVLRPEADRTDDLTVRRVGLGGGVAYS